MTSHDEFTGILPRRFRKWTYAVLAAVALVGLSHGVVTEEQIGLYIGALTAILGFPIASVNTRGDKTIG